MTAFSEEDIAEKSFAYSLLEGQRILYTLTVAVDEYEMVLTAFLALFLQKVNVVSERNIFCQRTQRLCEPNVQ